MVNTRPPATPDADVRPVDRLEQFIIDLGRRYRAVALARSSRVRAVVEIPASLRLAQAALHYDRCVVGRPPQVSVIGPTQTGKSTIVNLLLGASIADVSPLAGHTVHSQGFLIGLRDAAARWTQPLFPELTRVDRLSLDRRRLDCWSLESIDSSPTPITEIHHAPSRDATATRLSAPADGEPRSPSEPHATSESNDRSASSASALLACAPRDSTIESYVVWDTPDFDSLASHEYRAGVLEAAALADVHVMVLSKEKYSDLSAWRMLALLEPLGRPLILCVNKLNPDVADVIVASLRARLAERTPAFVDAPILQLPYVDGSVGPPPESPEAAALRSAVSASAARQATQRSSVGVAGFIRRHWDDWLAPVRVEHAARSEWRSVCDRLLDDLLAAYRRDYLDHPQRFDSFRRATAELLHLLELPAIGGTLSGVRNAVAWPFRKLVGASRAWWLARSGTNVEPRISDEERVLHAGIEELLVSAQREVARRHDAAGEDEPYWRSVASRLAAHHDELVSRFRAAARAHHELFTREIHEAAGRLYEHLKKSPATLNALRTARFTADVASILLAIKMGGASLNDLVFAPATFGLVSVMTEGAVGSYMRTVAAELRNRQLEHVRARLIDHVFRDEFMRLGHGADDTLFQISPDDLASVERAKSIWLGAAHA